MADLGFTSQHALSLAPAANVAHPRVILMPLSRDYIKQRPLSEFYSLWQILKRVLWIKVRYAKKMLLWLGNAQRATEAPKPDERARSLLQDLRENDPQAREIVERVDRGAYGTKGRKASATQVKSDSKTKARSPSKTGGDEQSSNSSSTIKDGSGSMMGGPPPSIQGRGRMVGLGQEMEANSLATAQ